MKNIKRFLLAAAAVILCLSLFACSAGEHGSVLRANTETLLNAVADNDFQTAYRLFADTLTQEEMSAFFPRLREYIGEITEYSLMQIGFNLVSENGSETYTATYYMKSDGGKFIINSTKIDGVDGIANFNITRAEDYFAVYTDVGSYVGSHPLQIVALVFFAAEVAFVVLMVIDCMRRRVNKRGLWVIVMLLGMATVCVEVGESLSLNCLFGSFYYFTALVIRDASYVVRIMIPVGAIVYACVRKRLKVKEKFPGAVYGVPVEYGYPEDGASAGIVDPYVQIEYVGRWDLYR